LVTLDQKMVASKLTSLLGVSLYTREWQVPFVRYAVCHVYRTWRVSWKRQKKTKKRQRLVSAYHMACDARPFRDVLGSQACMRQGKVGLGLALVLVLVLAY
jgi:hypothetical protein